MYSEEREFRARRKAQSDKTVSYETSDREANVGVIAPGFRRCYWLFSIIGQSAASSKL